MSKRVRSTSIKIRAYNLELSKKVRSSTPYWVRLKKRVRYL